MVKSEYSEFIKDNYKNLKDMYPNESRAQIMKRIGEMWGKVWKEPKVKAAPKPRVKKEKPKSDKPLNAYAQYVKDNFQIIHDMYTKEKPSQIIKRVAEMYKMVWK